MQRFWPVVAAIGLVFCTAPAFGQVTFLMNEASIAARDYAAEQRCKHVSASGLLLLQFQQHQLRATVVGANPRLAATLDKMIAESERAAAQEDCVRDTVADRMRRLDVTRKIFYIRAAAVLNLEQWLPYAAHLSVLSEKRDAIRRVMDQIEIQSNLTSAWPETIRLAHSMLANLCRERKTARWANGERPCPKLSVGQAEMEFGATMLKQIEAYIAADDIIPPPAVASSWSTSFSAPENGAPVCHIERNVGSARLSGDAGDGGIFSFSINAEIPQSAAQPFPPEPARISLQGYVGVDGLAAVIVRKARLDFPGYDMGATGKAELTVGLMKFSPEIEGNSMILDDARGAGATGRDLILMTPALLTKAHIAAALPTGTKIIDAAVPDLAALLLGMSTLRQAYRQCWR